MSPPVRRLYRDQRAVSVTTAGVELAGPNTRRVGLVISAPIGSGGATPLNAATTYARHTDASQASGTVLASYTAPANTSALVYAYGWNQSPGAASLAAGVTPSGGVRQEINSWGSQEAFSTPYLLLNAGDKFDISVFNPNAGTFADLWISVNQLGAGGAGPYVTIDFAGRNTLNDGINLYGGQSPLVLWADHIGQMVREAINAISSSGTQTVSVLDIYEDCPCGIGG